MTTKVLTPEEKGQLTQLIGNDLGYIAAFFKIPSKQAEGNRVPFVAYPPQEKFITTMSGRDLTIKDSQCGSTSIVTAYFLKKVMTTPDTTAVIVAHEGFLTERLLHRAQVFYDSVPTQLKPLMDHSSTYEKRFPEINSVMYIGTARSQVFGRGEPIHYLLFSEEAFYLHEAYNRIMVPAMQRVPETGMIVRESTPNGEGGSFHEEIVKIRDGESVYKLHTMYWWENVDNTYTSDSPLLQNMPELQGPLELRSEEIVGELQWGWTEDQIRWRRYKIIESDVMFFQEHLESLETCFLTPGNPFYDPRVTVEIVNHCYDAPYRGPDGEASEAQVWFKPVQGGLYTVGIDPGQGKQTESVAHVWRWDLQHPRHEATLHGFYEPDIFAPKCKALSDYYGKPLVIPEANSHGLGLIVKMRDLGGVHMYYRRDIISGISGQYPGWLTTPKTKPYMLQQLKAILSQMETHDAEFIRQIRGFAELGDGKVGTTLPDDHHDAGCLAIIGALGRGRAVGRGFQGTSGFTDWDR